MNKEEDLQLLFTKLGSYLTNDDKKYDSTQMINSIISTIVQYFDCSYLKLAEALEVLNHMKRSDIHTKFSDSYNRFDISGGSELSVKGFLSKGQPILFFYSGNDENPYAIVKTEVDGKKDRYSIEISNNPEVLATYKKAKPDVSSDAYVVVEEYEYYLDKCQSTRNVYAETVPAKQSELLNIADFRDIEVEHRNFFTLLINAMGSNGIDFSQVSAFGTDILFLSFYDTIKTLSGENSGIELQDLIYLINETLYSDKYALDSGNSRLIRTIEEFSETADTDMQKKMSFDMLVDNRKLRYDIVRSEKYLSIDIFENNQKCGGAMIVGTTEGFSFIRTVPSSDMQNEDYVSSYVINFSNGKIKFMTMSKDTSSFKKTGRTIEMVLTFDKSGRMRLASTDSTVSKMQMSQANLSQNATPAPLAMV